ncbi:MAG: hypothetical protein ACLSAH_14295 [Bilophila wadsworthia]
MFGSQRRDPVMYKALQKPERSIMPTPSRVTGLLLPPPMEAAPPSHGKHDGAGRDHGNCSWKKAIMSSMTITGYRNWMVVATPLGM